MHVVYIIYGSVNKEITEKDVPQKDKCFFWLLFVFSCTQEQFLKKIRKILEIDKNA